MGMSAAQARLLSITARLSNNELESQLLTNSKVRLATESQRVSDAYMQALSSTKLNFVHYNDKGESESFNLTPAVVYSYEPLKNQYSIQNTQGKNLVNSKDAKNYKETNTLHEFLERYDLLEKVQNGTTTETQKNPAYDEWVDDHKNWEQDKPNPDDYTKEVITETTTTRVNSSPIYAALTSTLSLCFGFASKDSCNCYMHVLSALIGVGEHTTTTGETYTISYTTSGCVEDGEDWCWNTYGDNEEIGDELRATLLTDKCSDEAYDDYITTDYGTVYCQGDGTDSKKYENVYQKIVDLLWEVHEDYFVKSDTGGAATPENLAKFFYFIEFDLGESETITENIVETVPDEEGYQNALEQWENNEPPAPPEYIDVEVPAYKAYINDKEKGQWYVNLWYLMNGSETANLVKPTDIITDGVRYFEVLSAEKDDLKSNYQAIDENQLKDASWMQYALENGLVSLKKTQYYDPSENSGKVLDMDGDAIAWNDIVYSNSEDIYSTEDEEAISKAQAEYERATIEIERKDNEYDIDLKNLDTIHNALQTEYESVKGVISKNVERSFKAFS